MTVSVVVDEINGGTAYVKHFEPTGEKAKNSRSFWKVKEKSFPVDNPAGLSLEAGDKVEIFVNPGKTIGVTFRLFIVPLLLFVALNSLLKGALGFSEALSVVLSAAFGIGGGLALSVLWEKKSPSGRPKVEKVLPPDFGLSGACGTSGCDSCGGCG